MHSPLVSSSSTARFLNPSHVLSQVGLQPGMQVADFGCGAGDWVMTAAQLVGPEGEVYAIDIQDSALSSVRSRARLSGALNVICVRANLEVVGATGLADASLDVVLFTNILFQSQRKEDVIKEAHRVLKSGGMLVFVDWRKDVSLGPAPSLRVDKKEITALIEQKGFAFTKEIDAGAYHFGMMFTKVKS